MNNLCYKSIINVNDIHAFVTIDNETHPVDFSQAHVKLCARRIQILNEDDACDEKLPEDTPNLDV